MKGIDISHWQNEIDWSKVAEDNQDFKFAIMKVTEGTGYLDPKFANNQKEAREAGLLCGYYHYARGAGYKAEAEWFLRNVGEIKEGELVVLDYEIYTLADPAEWCKNWLEYVESKIGFKPLLYTYHALINKYNWGKVSEANFGLWVARYGLQESEPNEKYAPAIGGAFFNVNRYLSKGDTIDMRAYHNNGGDINLEDTETSMDFSIQFTGV